MVKTRQKWPSLSKLFLVVKNIPQTRRTWPSNVNHSQKCQFVHFPGNSLFARQFCPRVWGTRPNNSSRRGPSLGRRLPGRASSSLTRSTPRRLTPLNRLTRGFRLVSWASTRALSLPTGPHTFAWLAIGFVHGVMPWSEGIVLLISNAVEIALIVYQTKVMMSL